MVVILTLFEIFSTFQSLSGVGSYNLVSTNWIAAFLFVTMDTHDVICVDVRATRCAGPPRLPNSREAGLALLGCLAFMYYHRYYTPVYSIYGII